MARAYKPYIPKGVSEIADFLGMMLLKSPMFVDETGYFPGRNLRTPFCELNESLRLIRGKVGDEQYSNLVALPDRMRAHFAADSENQTDDAVKGGKSSSRWKIC